MIGYYVHHQGRGHLHRALALRAELDEPMTILSSLEPPADQPAGSWVSLERDDLGAEPRDQTARGQLHWVPVGDAGLRRRMHQISAWLDEARPRLLVVDVSVEVALLARLHGVGVVVVVLPGRRDDVPHRTAFDIADGLVAVWPPQATPSMLRGVDATVHARVHALGGLARFPVRRTAPRRAGPRRVVLLGGAGGSGLARTDVEAVVGSTPGWEWTVCGPPGSWHADVERAVRDADVVVCHAGQNAVAEVAAARRPAVVVPQDRPFDEQLATADTLRGGAWPALVEPTFPLTGWPERLERAASLDGERWSAWCDGGAARRFAEVLGSARPHVGAA